MARPNIIIIQNDKVVESIDLGLVNELEEKSYNITIRNIGDSVAFDIVVECNHPDVKIVEHSKSLNINSSGNIYILYKPETQLEKGLNLPLIIKARYAV